MTGPVCPYCRMSIDTATEAVTVCPSCATPHHRDCWAENEGCTVFGCSSAPVEETLIRVSDFELERGLGSPSAPESGAVRIEPGSLDSTGVAPPPPVNQTGNDLARTGSTPHFDPSWAGFTQSEVHPQSSAERKVYVVLAVFCGFLGAHNLYANRTTAGIIQLCVSMLSCFVAFPAVWIWALVEAATVDEDGDGYPMR